MVKIPLVIIGAGGFGREVHDVVEAMNAESASFDFLGFIDGHVTRPELLKDRGPLLGGDEVLESLSASTRYVIAISKPQIRRRIDQEATSRGMEAAILIHPSATLGRHRIEISPGTIICSHASLTTDIVLARHVHLHVNTTIGHDAVLGNYVSVNPGATVSGNVVLGDDVMIGTGASVIQGLTIGARAVVGAGAAVVRDIPADATAVGVPAKPIDHRP